MDWFKSEINKVKTNKALKNQFFDYCVKTLQKSPDSAIDYYNKFIEHPQEIPYEELKEIFIFLNLDTSCLQTEPQEHQFLKEINHIIVKLIELEKYGYDKDINDIVVKLVTIKNRRKDGND